MAGGQGRAFAQSVHLREAREDQGLQLGPGVKAVFYGQELFPVLQRKDNLTGLQELTHLGQGAQGVRQGFKV